jgi:hypothetical protein
MFIERRKTALVVDDIAKGLELGGFDFKPLNWTENARVRNVAISLAKNPKIFHKLPNGTWGLTAWYPNIVQSKKDRAEKDASPEVEATDALSKGEGA